MIKYTPIWLLLLGLITAGCSENNLEDYRNTITSPSVETGEILLNGYTLDVKGIVENSQKNQIVEIGICYNESKDGEPSHENEKSRIVKTQSVSDEFQLQASLFPEREYNVRAYAINASGKSYGSIKQITTGAFDPLLLLPGKYVAHKHINYFSWNSTRNYYEDYEVSIKLKDNKLSIDSLGCAPNGWDPLKVSLKMDVSHVITDTTNYYAVEMPLQMTELQVEMSKKVYPVLFLSSEWMLYGGSNDSKSVTGKIIISNDSLYIDLETGFTFAACDPISHEIFLEEAPLDIVIAPLCFEIKNEEDLALAPKCRLYKKD